MPSAPMVNDPPRTLRFVVNGQTIDYSLDSENDVHQLVAYLQAALADSGVTLRAI